MGKWIFQLLLFFNCWIYFRNLKAFFYLFIKGWFSFDHMWDQSWSNASSLRNARLWSEISLWDFHDHRGLISSFGLQWPQAWRSEGIMVFCALLLFAFVLRMVKELSIPTFISKLGWQSIRTWIISSSVFLLRPRGEQRLFRKWVLGNYMTIMMITKNVVEAQEQAIEVHTLRSLYVCVRVYKVPGRANNGWRRAWGKSPSIRTANAEVNTCLDVCISINTQRHLIINSKKEMWNRPIDYSMWCLHF